MRAIGLVCALVVPMLLAPAGRPLAASPIVQQVQGDSDVVAWNHTVARLLQQDLWGEATAYDAGHFLMVPLHAAFALHARAWETQFAEHFARFVTSGFGPRLSANSRLDRLQYAYLASRFCALSVAAGQSAPPGLLQVLGDLVTSIWSQDTAFAWGRPFAGGVRDRLAWKLSNAPRAKGYYAGIDDVEEYLFAVAGDLRQVERATGVPVPGSAVVGEILDAARRTFASRGRFQPDGGWLFQPGVWSDYADFLYAGQPAKVPGMARAPVDGIAEDASHSFRMPLFLTSLAEAYPEGDSLREAYLRMRRGVAKQLMTHVVVPPSTDFPGYRLTNYMDGRNGVYRWGYANRANWGFGPFELSSSLMVGWWAFSSDRGVQGVYSAIATAFPLAPAVLALYTGGSRVTDSGDPRSIVRDSYANGLRKLIVHLASELPLDPER